MIFSIGVWKDIPSDSLHLRIPCRHSIMFLAIYIYILLKLPFPLITFLCVLMFDKISFPIYITLTFLASKFFPIILHVQDSENEITFSISHVNLSKDQEITCVIISRYKVLVLTTWVPGASHPPKFFFLFYPSKAWIPSTCVLCY